ncbi:hypothetical protein O181_116125 [Austropuccinia psidii MF-1]|uniref:Uncharacterized protein n=1 Tax=Austropuccinia psidii MF-1 TaxID=1389203 RepID=A0A9Q3PX42_9BASI|nr:hypothetical protein [Austropuccinia psidii MF-1]
MKVQGPFGAEFITVGLPCTLWGGHDLGGPGPHQWAQAIKVGVLDSGPIYGPLAPLGPHQIWPQGASNSPHGPQTVDHGVWPMVRRVGPRRLQ